ncbi:MAG: hypothetical protein OHK0013_29420 [Sandaracinaceae bacterium]
MVGLVAGEVATIETIGAAAVPAQYDSKRLSRKRRTPLVCGLVVIGVVVV